MSHECESVIHEIRLLVRVTGSLEDSRARKGSGMTSIVSPGRPRSSRCANLEFFQPPARVIFQGSCVLDGSWLTLARTIVPQRRLDRYQRYYSPEALR